MRVRLATVFVLLAFAAAGVAQQPDAESPVARRVLAEHRALERSRAVLCGRCVDGITGAPLAGCRVVVGTSSDRPDLERSVASLLPPAVTTADDGRFELQVLAHEAVEVTLLVTRDGCWPRTARWRHLWPGEQVQLGDVRLSVGVPARVEVRDDAGQPVSGVPLAIERMPFHLHAEAAGVWANRTAGLGSDSAQHSVSLRSDEAGLATSVEALPPGRFDLRVGAGEYGLSEPQRITIPASGDDAEPQLVVVRRRASFGGQVVDEAGGPIAGVELRAIEPDIAVGMVTRTDADGMFRLHRVGDPYEEVRLRVLSAPATFDIRGSIGEFDWGDDDVRVVLRRGLTLDVAVVLAGSGAPVEGFAVRVDGGAWKRTGGHAAEGTLRLEGIARGRGWLAIVPDDPALRCAQLRFVAGDETPALRVEVEQLVPMLVQVVGAGGDPLADCVVQVIEPGDEWPLPTLIDPRAGSAPMFAAKDTRDMLLHRAVTDGGGQCIVYGVDGRDDLVLHVRRGDAVEERVRGVAFGREHGTRKIRLYAK
ncbi:MAG: carboxypeptidase-like regulatory domain-containing protein [Planctomycetota bacterium]